jgi:hypothetical protein
MKKQFENVSGRYGSPMGRSEYGTPENTEEKSIRVFKVRIDSQGYDDGGAYWGIGQALYCATDGDEYRRFIRAHTRIQAIAGLNIPACKIIAKPVKMMAKIKNVVSLGYGNPVNTRLLAELTELGY